jgi:ATP-dependent Clp protease ATP-binding subunit ClpA
MFERFDKPARRALADAQAEAQRLDHGWIGTEHVLLGLLLQSEGTAAVLLDECGVTHASVLDRTLAILGQADGTIDAYALRSIGIDLEEVRRAVEDTFGPGALDQGRAKPCATRAFTARAKKVLELSLREALARQDRHIGTEHLLLAILRDGDGIAAKILAEAGVSAEAVRRRLRPGA